MITPEEWLSIKTLKQKGHSQRQIAKILGISRNTVKKHLTNTKQPSYKREAPYLSVIDNFKDYIQERLEKYPKLSADRIYREITEKGFSGSYETVARYIRLHQRKKTPQAYERFETLPGQQAQVDWGECSDKLNHFGVQKKVYAFTMTLGYSRSQYVEFTLDMSLETLLHCHINAFQYFGGMPQNILYDNMKTVVEDHIGDVVRFNKRFLDFAAYYGFQPHATRVCYPEAKGKVERAIGYVWSSFYIGREFDSLEQMNNEVRIWLDTVCNVRIHGTIDARPVDRLAEEKSYLLALREKDYDIFEPVSRKVHKDCYFSYKQNYYSVPHAYASTTVQIKVYREELHVIDKDRVIAVHRICPFKRQFIKNPAHFENIHRRQRGAVERYRTRFDEYGKVGSNFFETSIRERQPNPYYHWKRILEFSSEYDDDIVVKAFRHCLDYGVFNFTTFRNIMSRFSTGRHQSVSQMITFCGRCKPELPSGIERPLEYYNLTMPTSN